MRRFLTVIILFAFGVVATAQQPANSPMLRTLELFPEDFAGKTFTYPVWVFSEGINKDKNMYVIQFRDGDVAPAEAGEFVGHTMLRTNKLNFVLTKDQAKGLCEELGTLFYKSHRAYKVEFTIEKEQAKGGYPVAKILSLRKVTE